MRHNWRRSRAGSSTRRSSNAASPGIQNERILALVHRWRAGLVWLAGGAGSGEGAAGLRHGAEQLRYGGAEHVVGGAGAVVHNAHAVLHGRDRLVLGGRAFPAGSGRSGAGSVRFADHQWGTAWRRIWKRARRTRWTAVWREARLCSTVTVDGEPRDPSPHGGETGAPGELQNAEPGDVLQIEIASSRNCWSRTGTTGCCGAGSGSRRAPQDHAASRTLSEQCLAQHFDRGTPHYSWSWDYLHDPTGANAQGTTVRKEVRLRPPGRTWRPDCGRWRATWIAPTGGCYAARTSGVWGAPPDVIVNGNAGFAGVPGGATANLAENHASYAQVAAPESEKKWMLDGRPFQPDAEVVGRVHTGGRAVVSNVRLRRSDGDDLSGADIVEPVEDADIRVLRYAAVARREQRRDGGCAERGDDGFVQILRIAAEGRVPVGRADPATSGSTARW